MKFTDVLQRYHIAPLKYDDDKILDEKDYFELSKILHKYVFMKNKFDNNFLDFEVNENLVKKVEHTLKNSLMDLSEEDIMDILMEQN